MTHVEKFEAIFAVMDESIPENPILIGTAFSIDNAFIEELKKEKSKSGTGKSLEFYTKHYKIRPYKDVTELKQMIIILIEANFPIRKKTEELKNKPATYG